MKHYAIMLGVAVAVIVNANEESRESLEQRLTKHFDNERAHGVPFITNPFISKAGEHLDVFRFCVAKAAKEDNADIRKKMFRTIESEAKQAWGESGGGLWCTNEVLIGVLLDYYSKVSRPDGSGLLVEMLSPKWLNQHTNMVMPVFEAKLARKELNAHLYAMLDFTTLEQVRQLLGVTNAEPSGVNLGRDWMLARKGDTKAEERLIAFATAPRAERPLLHVKWIGQAMGNAGTERLMRLAATELRTEDYIERWYNGGEGTFPTWTSRREIWMWAVYTAMRNDEDPTTPGQPSFVGGSAPDAMMDTLERWCTKKYGVQYVGPRKQIPFINTDKPPSKGAWIIDY